MKSKLEIIRDIFRNEATDEDRQYYINNYMSAEEKQVGKPYFDMGKEEEKEYKVLCYNNKQGNMTDYNCPKCKNRGDFMYYEGDYEMYSTCSCMAIRATLRKMQASGLGALLKLYTFDKYEYKEDWQKDAYNKAKSFVSGGGNWFCMLGESGSGKSHLCTAISRELLEKGMNLKYMMWIDESNELKRVVIDKEEYERLIKPLKETQVLYIDDLFKSENNTKPSPADIKLAFEILNYRYNKARMDKSKRWITIISCERTLEQLMEYDSAIAGRIAEMTKPNNLIVIKAKYKNYRLRDV